MINLKNLRENPSLYKKKYKERFIKNPDQLVDEIVCDKGACIEFRFCNGNWYILSSDGLKQS